MNEYQDPSGFADMHWGETLKDIQDSHQTKLEGFQNGSASYSILIPDAHGSVYFTGPVTVKGLFMDNKLYSIVIPFSKGEATERLLGLSKMWGMPKELKANELYSWEGPFTLVYLMNAPAAKNGCIGLIMKRQEGQKNQIDNSLKKI